MVSVESIDRRLDDPKAYILFYKFFYKAAVGEPSWKNCILDEELRFGNDTTEAFALLVFGNNYKAWLFEEKEKHKEGLMTKYDTPTYLEDYTSIVDYILADCELNLDKATDQSIVTDKSDRYYKSSKKKRTDWLRKFIASTEAKEVKENVLDKAMAGCDCKAKAITSADDENEDSDEEYTGQERTKVNKKRKRRLTRELRKYTGKPNENERKFKGWSDEGMEAFEKWIEVIKKDVENVKYKVFEKVYQKVVEEVIGFRDDSDDNQKQKKYVPKKNLMWEEL